MSTHVDDLSGIYRFNFLQPTFISTCDIISLPVLSTTHNFLCTSTNWNLVEFYSPSSTNNKPCISFFSTKLSSSKSSSCQSQLRLVPSPDYAHVIKTAHKIQAWYMDSHGRRVIKNPVPVLSHSIHLMQLSTFSTLYMRRVWKKQLSLKPCSSTAK